MVPVGGWSLRRAGPADADGLAPCLTAAYAAHAARLPDLPAMADGVAEDLARCQVWVAEADSTIVGGLVLAPQAGYLRLANVAVHPNARGAGLGRALIGLVERQAAAQGYRELRLNSHAGMVETLRLYARLGWMETGRQGNTVAMTKTL